MELEISIEKRDRNLEKDLFETLQPKVGEEKIIAEGVSIRIKNWFARDAADLPTILNIVAEIGERIALPIAVSFLSRYLYDKLKDRKESKVTINYVPVEMNVEKIEQHILNMRKEEKKYPERLKYFNFKKSEGIRYFKFKVTCPNCGKVCVEDILAERCEKFRRQSLVCHRCGHSTNDLVWKRTV